MLLRASSAAIGSEVDPAAIVAGDQEAAEDADRSVDIGSGVEQGAVLAAYADAAHRGDGLADATAALRGALGDAGWVEAAMTVAVFDGLVRTADASGIPLDSGVVSATAADRDALGLDAFAGSANSDLTISGGAAPHPSRFG